MTFRPHALHLKAELFVKSSRAHVRDDGFTRCNLAPVAAHVLAIFPVFCGISGSTITILIFTSNTLLSCFYYLIIFLEL